MLVLLCPSVSLSVSCRAGTHSHAETLSHPSCTFLITARFDLHSCSRGLSVLRSGCDSTENGFDVLGQWNVTVQDPAW